MPNIPLQDVPNVPQVSTGLPDTQSDIKATRMAYGQFREDVQQRQAPADFGQAPYEGLKQLGRGLESFGGSIGQITEEAAKMRVQRQTMEGQDSIQLAHENYMADVAKTPGMDPNDIVKGWQDKKQDVYNSVLGNQSLAPMAKQNLSMFINHWDAKTTGQMALSAASHESELTKKAFYNRVDSMVDAGDMTGAHAAIDQMKSQRIDFPEVLDEYAKHIDNKSSLLQFEKQINADPLGSTKDLSSLWDGEGKYIPGKTNLSEEQAYKLYHQSLQAFHAQSGELFRNESQLIDNNLISDFKQVEDRSQGYLSGYQQALLKAKFNSHVVDPEQAAQLWHDVSAYNPALDHDGSQRLNLDNRIEMMPDGRRGGFRDLLRDAGHPNGIILNSINSRINQMAKNGAFGDDDNQTWEKTLALQMQWKDYMKSNPSATVQDGVKWLNQHAENDVRAKAAKEIETQDNGSHWYNPFSWGKSESKAPASQDEIDQKQHLIDNARSILNSTGIKATGTMYGYSSDPNGDSRSSKGIGAFVSQSEEDKIRQGFDSNQKLRPGDIAVSPDMEARLKSSGVKPYDTIAVKFSDGSTATGRWADRTMQDEDAKKKFGAPLRNRFDFYSPSGSNPNNGKTVVGFSKA